MSHILLIGGHGNVALRLAPRLVAAGHQVTSAIRNPDHQSEVEAGGAQAVIADVEHLSTEELADVVSGHEALVWLAGAGGGDPSRTEAVDHLAAVRSMDVAVGTGMRRYVMLSYLGASLDHGIDPESSFYAYAQAKAAADHHLRQSTLDWTVIGPGSLTSDPGTGRIEIADQPAASSVSRDDVAAVIAATIENPTTVGHTLNFNSGPTPIVEAIRQFTV